jgi:hypothetical protein
LELKESGWIELNRHLIVSLRFIQFLGSGDVVNIPQATFSNDTLQEHAKA